MCRRMSIPIYGAIQGPCTYISMEWRSDADSPVAGSQAAETTNRSMRTLIQKKEKGHRKGNGDGGCLKSGENASYKVDDEETLKHLYGL